MIVMEHNLVDPVASCKGVIAMDMDMEHKLYLNHSRVASLNPGISLPVRDVEMIAKYKCRYDCEG